MCILTVLCDSRDTGNYIFRRYRPPPRNLCRQYVFKFYSFPHFSNIPCQHKKFLVIHFGFMLTQRGQGSRCPVQNIENVVNYLKLTCMPIHFVQISIRQVILKAILQCTDSEGCLVGVLVGAYKFRLFPVVG